MSKLYHLIPDWTAGITRAVIRLNATQIMSLAAEIGDESEYLLSIEQLQRKLHLSTADATSLARTLKNIMRGTDVTTRDIKVALMTIAEFRTLSDQQQKEIVEVVCTTPFRPGIPVRATFATLLEMIRAANDEIFVVGYIFTEGAKELVEQLSFAQRKRSVRVTLIGNRIQDHLPALRSVWPEGSPAPSVYSREADSYDSMAALHAKLLICDGKTALITSANFSHHGMHENIEVGVKIMSASVARLVDFIRFLIENGEVTAVKWNA